MYLKTEEVEPLRKKIEERKSIEKKISSLKDKPCSNYITNVRTGRPLDNFAVSTSKFRRRDGINNLQDYISGDYPGKVFILYGLRRTGKTTLISQMLYEMKKEREHAAYIKVSSHILDFVDKIKDEIIFLKSGHIVIGKGVTIEEQYRELFM